MNVKELKEILNEYTDETEVILSKDGEGNSFSPLSGNSNGLYIPDTTYSGHVYHNEWSAIDADLDEEEWAEMKKEMPISLILWPIN